MIDAGLQKELKQKYNPEGSTLRAAQLRMLELLKFLDKICKEHNLSYWLDGGTLLGAARHGGFIPWDDDTDICMPRADALKLKEILKSEIHEDHIVLQTTESDKNYSNSSWMTLRDLKSRYIQNLYQHNQFKYQGLQVDIFLTENNIPRAIKKLTNIIHHLLIYYPLENKYHTKIFRPLVNINHRILDNAIYPFLRLFKNHKNTITYGVGAPFKNEYKKTDIYPLRKILFEGYEFNCPNNIDSYLTNLYGSWMEIPDEDHVIIHTHNIEVYD